MFSAISQLVKEAFFHQGSEIEVFMLRSTLLQNPEIVTCDPIKQLIAEFWTLRHLTPNSQQSEIVWNMITEQLCSWLFVA